MSSPKNKKCIKVRFNLSRGLNFQRWQVRDGDSVEYYDPEDVVLLMLDATLRNQRKTAERIKGGENKTVCAWVECKDLVISPAPSLPMGIDNTVHYNPRKEPHWTDCTNADVDNKNYSKLMTYGRLITIPL
jgi:hypothetical protein